MNLVNRVISRESSRLATRARHRVGRRPLRGCLLGLVVLRHRVDRVFKEEVADGDEAAHG